MHGFGVRAHLVDELELSDELLLLRTPDRPF